MHTRERAHVSPLLTAGLPLTRSALEFAKERYGGDVQHPLEVAAELRHASCPDEVVASGVLHDVLETTDTDVSELAERFGKHVARLVEAVSEDTSIEDYDERKAALRAQAGGKCANPGCPVPRTHLHHIREWAVYSPMTTST